MLSEKSRARRNKWYRDHVNKYCVSINKNDVDVIQYVEALLKKKSFSAYVKNKVKEDLAKDK